MPNFKTSLVLLAIVLFLCCNQAVADTFTSCYKSTCAIITVPDRVAPGEEFEIEVEGYIENATSWDTSAYLLLEGAEWSYNSNHMITYTGEKLDAKGFNWGASLVKKYRLKGLDKAKKLTFMFGSRSREHGYYDVAVDAFVEVASPAVSVAFDIKPQSCPNPLNVNKKGVLSAAIVGSPDFDVREIDLASIKLAGVTPIHSSYEDVTEPYYPLTGKAFEFDCTDAGADGYLDLTLKFRAQEVYAALQDLHDQPLKKDDLLNLEMTALLSSLGTPVVGEDIIRINARK